MHLGRHVRPRRQPRNCRPRCIQLSFGSGAPAGSPLQALNAAPIRQSIDVASAIRTGRGHTTPAWQCPRRIVQARGIRHQKLYRAVR